MFRDSVYALRWSAKKVATRDVFYVPRRVSYSLRKKVVDAVFPLLPDAGELVPHLAGEPAVLLGHFRSRKRPAFHFSPKTLRSIAACVPEGTKILTINEANHIVARRFSFRTSPRILLRPIDWSCIASGIDDAGWRWDLNRHFWFTTLGLAYAYTGQAVYAMAFIELVSDWIDTYTHFQGRIPWDHPFEVAARINAWIWAYFLFLEAPEWTSAINAKFLRTLGRLAEYLYQVFEYHNPGNHVLLEAKALALVAELFPEFKGANRWGKKAWSVLNRELKKQIGQDGVHCERSTMYHRIVAGELAELLAITAANNVDKAPSLVPAVELMADFLVWIGIDSDLFPLFGDAYAADSYFRFSAPVILAAIDPHPNDREAESSVNDQTLFAICGLTANGVRQRARDMATSAKAFSVGGYFVSRSDETPESILVWDCGPVGYAANPYHSHLDALSFYLAVDGVPIFIDPGTNENERMRRVLRGTGSHNTVLIDGENQSILAKWDEVWSLAKSTLTFFGSTPLCDVMIGSHNGFERLRQPVTHMRTIVTMRNQYWLVVDRLIGEGAHQAEQRFHLAPGTEAVPYDVPGTVSIRKEHVTLNFTSVFVPETTGESDGQETRIEDATAELYCQLSQPIKVINTSRFGTVPFSIASIIAKPVGDTFPSIRMAVDVAEEGPVLTIESEAWCDHIFMNAPQKPCTTIQHWAPDAKILILRETQTGGVTSISAGASQIRTSNPSHLRQSSTDRLVQVEHFCLTSTPGILTSQP